MAGHRRQHGRPARSEAHSERQRASFHRRLAEARTPRHQVSLAFDYLRMRMTEASPTTQTALAEQVVRLLVGLAEQIETGHPR